nr:unnamed protein product [Spirometra erinaceieuropaei]
MPLLADPSFARFSQELGLASLGASDDEVKRLASVYFFTVEFGLCNQDGELRAYGAGLLSSIGELKHALSDVSVKKPFVPEEVIKAECLVTTFQNAYFHTRGNFGAHSGPQIAASDSLQRRVTLSRTAEVVVDSHSGNFAPLASACTYVLVTASYDTHVCPASICLVAIHCLRHAPGRFSAYTMRGLPPPSHGLGANQHTYYR